MRYFLSLFINALIITLIPVFSQSENLISNDFYKISKISDGLYYMFIDSTNEKKVITKSTIVEFDNFIALVEIPIYNHKKSTDTLTDHIVEGEKILKTLNAYFPNKPIRYVLSSHWHPHSLSSVTPFVSSGATIVTTKLNFQRIKDFIDTIFYENNRDNFYFVEDENFTLKDNSNEIVVYKVDKTEYTSLPTQDYLYFYLGKYNYFHVSCMYQRFPKSKVFGKELLSPRTENLVSFIQKNKLSPSAFISMEPYFDEINNMISSDTLNMVINQGVMPSSVENYICEMTNNELMNNPDSLFKEFYKNSIPKYLINISIDRLLRSKELHRALVLAKFQAFYFPSDNNAWDTLGEVYYFLGDTIMAKRYESECLKIDKNYKFGFSSWEKDLKDYNTIWNSSKIK